MDIEDGLNLRWFTFEELIREIDEHLCGTYSVKEGVLDIIKFRSRGYEDGKVVPGGVKKAVIDFRFALVQYLVNLSSSNFLRNIETIDQGMYSQELIEDDVNHLADTLKSFTSRHILKRREVCKQEMTGRTVITGLLDQLSFYAFHEKREYRDKLKSVISRLRLEVAMHENLEPQTKSPVPSRPSTHSSPRKRLSRTRSSTSTSSSPRWIWWSLWSSTTTSSRTGTSSRAR